MKVNFASKSYVAWETLPVKQGIQLFCMGNNGCDIDQSQALKVPLGKTIERSNHKYLMDSVDLFGINLQKMF